MLTKSAVNKILHYFLAPAAGFAIILIFTHHSGIGIDPDSVVYLKAAQNLHQNGTLTDFMHQPVIEFPLFYPLFLSSGIFITGLQPSSFAPLLNAGLFALLIILSAYLLQKIPSLVKWQRTALLSCIVFSPAIMEVYSFLWSETLFLIFLLLFILSLNRYFFSFSKRILILTATLAALAAITRYAGITLIGTGALLIIVNRKLSLWKKLTDGLIFGLISSLPLVINLVRNYIQTGMLTGYRESSQIPLTQNLNHIGSALYNWLPFLNGHSMGAEWFAALVIIILLIDFIRLSLRKNNPPQLEHIATSFSLIYLLFILTIASISRFEILNSRFLSPVFIPLLFCFGKWIILATKRIPYHWLGMSVGLILFLLFQFGQLRSDYETWDGVKDAGIPGYTEEQWTASETVRFIQKDSLPFQQNHTIWSNANDAVYFFTGREGKFLPHKEFNKELQELLDDPHCYVVWFNDGENPDLVDKDFLVKNKKMTLVKEFDDGAIYAYDK